MLVNTCNTLTALVKAESQSLNVPRTSGGKVSLTTFACWYLEPALI